MKCPIDQTQLVISERQGIEIDYCPQCRGVWLDRGELDKLIERTAAAPPPGADQRPPPRQDERRYDDRRDYDQRGDYGDRPRRRRRGSFLEELFDFD